MKNTPSITRLLDIMKQLRDPDNGCPWDLEQDFSSISQHTIEEAYEVADAIARNNMDDLRDELGDLLFQSVFHAQLASELGAFDFDDVVNAICDKMIRRHPHIFASSTIDSAKAQTHAWEKYKSQEREEKGEHGTMAGIATTLPPVLRALKLQQRAAGVGFDWPDLEPVFSKLQEEIKELQHGIEARKGSEYINEELGDILFVCINLCRKLDVNPDAALELTNQKFIQRFRYIEEALESKGKTVEQSSLHEMDALWDEAKGKLK